MAVVERNHNYVWDVGTLSWLPETQPSGGGGGGGDASAANQVVGNASLASIDGKLTSGVTTREGAAILPASTASQNATSRLFTGTTTGTAIPVSGYASCLVYVYQNDTVGTIAGEIDFLGSYDGGITWTTVSGFILSTGDYVSRIVKLNLDTTTRNVYINIPCAGLTHIRGDLLWLTGGGARVSGTWTVIGSPSVLPFVGGPLPVTAQDATSGLSAQVQSLGADPNGQGQGLIVRNIPDAGSTQAISAASLPLPSLAATSTKQSDGSQKTQIVDGAGNVASMTSNAQDINIKSGSIANTSFIATQATGTNLHTVVDSGTITAVTAITNALPAGTNVIGHVINDASSAVIGHVIADTGSTTAVTGTVTTSQTNIATADYDTSIGTQTQSMVGIALPASGGAVAGGTPTNPLNIRPTDGTNFMPMGDTSARTIHTTIDNISTHVTIDGGAINQGSSAGIASGWPVILTDGTRTQGLKAASTAAAAADISAVVALSPNSPLPAGLNVIGHVITDSGSATTVTGNVTVIQGTGTNLHTVVDSGTITTVSAVTGITNPVHVIADSGTITAVTGITNALPAGTNLLGKVGIDQTTPGTTNAVQVTNAFALEATQLTGNTSIASVKTNTDPLLVAGAGGYVRQDSTATIAKESGGNLATLVTNTTGLALDATLTAPRVVSGTTTAPAKIVVVGGATNADTPQFLPLPLVPQGIAVATQERNDPSDIILQNLLTEMRLMRQSFQDWSGATPRYDPVANYNFQ